VRGGCTEDFFEDVSVQIPFFVVEGGEGGDEGLERRLP
jgi:hypothetical protein